jgi:hypothetical protein
MRSFFLSRLAVIKNKQLSVTENGEYAQVNDCFPPRAVFSANAWHSRLARDTTVAGTAICWYP